MILQPEHKIQVFLSSACGDEPEKQKYKFVREALRLLIDSTGFAQTYVFEDKGASSASAGQHYSSNLEDCDLCIFLIDNNDGVSQGVQIEIDLARKYNKKSLFYFCDQTSKNETPLQKMLKGASYAKSKVVHDFKDLIERGPADFLNDLINIYRDYCKGRLIFQEESSSEQPSNIPLENVPLFSDTIAHKDVLTNVDGCVNYLSKLILDISADNEEKTGSLDKLMLAFLPVLFEGADNYEDSLNLLLHELLNIQTSKQFVVTEKRYKAIERFFSGDLEGCLLQLREALQWAKQNDLPDWFIKDILIDLRNQEYYFQESRNSFNLKQEYQIELDKSQSLLFYPLIDRLDSNFYEGIVKEAVKNKTQAPETVSFGNGMGMHIRSLAGLYVIAIYNGSLTHLQLLFQRIKLISFYCAMQYSDWNIRKLLLKTTIISGNQKEIDGVIRCFDDLLSKMDENDAYEIYSFSSNMRIAHKQIIYKFEAFRIVSNYLDDEKFNLIWSELSAFISNWIENENSITTIGHAIFPAIERSHLRISQDQLIDVICNCIHHNKRLFYNDVFRLIWRCVDLDKASKESVESLLDVICTVLRDPDERNHISCLEKALYTLRKKNRKLTEELDKVISEEMPNFYCRTYRLETTNEEVNDIPKFLESYIDQIQNDNELQGRNGTFLGRPDRPHITVKNIISQSKFDFSDDLITSAFQSSCQTILKEYEETEAKMDAIELLVYLLRSRVTVKQQNRTIIQEVLTSKPKVENAQAFLTNLGETNLRLSALLLYNCMGENVVTDLLITLVDIGDDTLSNRYASAGFLNYLNADNSSLSDKKMEQVILQRAVAWCANTDLNTRWNAVQILFLLLRNLENKDVVCNQLVRLMDKDNVYIKNKILKNIHLLKDVDYETYNYVMLKASVDTNYVVRKVVTEVKKEFGQLG